MIPNKEVIENCSSQDKKLVSSTKEDCTVNAEQIVTLQNVANEDSESMSSSESEESQTNNTTKKKSKRIKKAQQLQKKVLKSRKQKNKDQALVDVNDDNFNLYTSISLGQKLKFHEIIFFICSVVTLGLLNIINRWLKNRLYEKIVFKEVKKLEKATHLICKNDNIQQYLLIQKQKIQVNESCDIDTYVFKTNYNTYFWNEQVNCFQDVYMLFQSWDLQEFLDTTKNGISETTANHLQDTYGQNQLIFQRTSFFKFLFDLLSNPISVFELTFLTLLFVFKYKLYFAGLLILLIVKTIKEIINFTKREKRFKEKYVLKENVMVVRRIEQNIFKKRIVNSQQLVPGDLIEITNNLSIPADVLLTYGKCVIQNSLDKQEDNTMTKVAVEKFQTIKLSQIEEQNLLYAGSKVLYTLNNITEGCFGVVVRTGFNTKRGKLIKQKVSKNGKNKLIENDMFYFYSILTIIAISLSIITLAYEHLYSHNLQNFQNEMVQKIFQIFLVLLKPTIPLALIATVDQSIKNLKNKKIITNDQKQISSLGKSNRCFIDQDIFLQNKFTDCCFLISKNKEAQTYKTFDKLITNTKKIAKKIQRKPIMKRYIESFGLCNMVTKIGDEYYGPIEDIEMLKKSNFELHYDFEEKESIKRYFAMDQKFSKDFSSSYETLRFFEVNSYQRNFKSAVVKNAENQHFLYCKGDPISLQHHCARNTIPYNFEQTMSKYSLKGYKCIALAYKQIDQNQVDYKRDELEKNMTFLGFYLKKVQTDSQNNVTIENLVETDMNIILTTKKSLYLALSTAKESQIISHNNPVLLGKTKELNKVDSLVWEKLESVKTEQENYNLEKQDEINFYQEIMNTDNQIVVTGKALKLLTEELSEDQIKDVIKRIKVIGDLDIEQSKFIIEIFQKFIDERTPLCYIHDGNGDISLIQNTEISVSLKETELASKSSFYTTESNLEKFYQLLMESKQSITNTHKIYQFVIFFCICQLFGLITLYFQRTSYGLVHIFFLDFFLLMAFSVIQSNLQGSYKFKLKSRSIFNKQFWSFVSTMGIYGITVMFMILQLLQKTKFYKSPIQIAFKTKNLNPNKNYFYDPFVTFMTLIILSICFFTLNNKNQIRLKNCGSFLYLVLLVSSSLLILFGNQVAEITQSQDIKMLFRIPDMNGFEFLFCLFIPIIIIGFVTVKVLEKKLAKKWAIGFNKIKKLVQSDNDDTLSIQTSLYTESALDEESATHKKKSKLKKIPVKHKSKRSQREEGSTNRSISRNQSNIEKKRRVRRSRMKIKRKKRNISIDSDQINQ